MADKRAPAQRLVTVDQFKGLMVLLMLVYHSTFVLDQMNSVAEADQVRRHLIFLHSAFLFIAGFLCGYHYFEKAKHDARAVAIRLLTRGFKLLAIFAVSNAIAYFVLRHYDFAELAASVNTMPGFYEHCIARVSGNLFAFEILAYIAFYLWVASVTLTQMRLLVALVAMCLLAAIADSISARFIFIGLLGQLLGTLTSGDAWANRRDFLNEPWYPAFILSVFALTRPFVANNSLYDHTWYEPFVLAADALGWWSVTVVVAGWLPKKASDALQFLGRYTLLAYMMQMPLAHLASWICVKSSFPPVSSYCVSLAVLTVVMFGCLHLIDAARRRNAFVDVVYRRVFA